MITIAFIRFDNSKLGYPTIDIRSPKEIIYYEY